MRQLATIQKINSITPIPDADRVVMARVLDYECVVKKDDFKVGDLIVYIECDSLTPEKPEFEFLREVKFRIKIRRFRKQISEGLVMPISILPSDCKIVEGKEVTDVLDIKNYVRAEEESEENALANDKHRSGIMRFLMDIYIFRKIYLKMNSRIKGNWPKHIKKTDENRLQNNLKLLLEHYNEPWYITEKCNGQSGTVFTSTYRKLGMKRKYFGVCSRNVFLKTKNNSSYWKIAEKYDLQKKLLSTKQNVVIQMECCGPAIQKNDYDLKEIDGFVFNFFQDNKMLSFHEMEKECLALGIKTVPLLDQNFIPSMRIGENKTPKEIMDYMIKTSQGKSLLNKARNKEGIVVRLVDNPRISFKVINPIFLLEKN